MANEGEVRLEAKPINFEEMVRRLGAVEQGLQDLQRSAAAVDVDIDTSGLGEAEAAVRGAREELGTLPPVAERAGAEVQALGKKADVAADGLDELSDETGKSKGGLGDLGGALKLAQAAVVAFLGSLVFQKLKDFGGFLLESATAAAKMQSSFAGLEGVIPDEELGRLRDVANALGVSATAAQERFGPFVQTLVGAGGTADEGRVIFDAFALAISGAGKGAEDLDGVLSQLEQGISKGKFEMEDLKSITERLPNFLNIAKDAVGKLGAEAVELNEDGLIPVTTQLKLIAPALAEAFSERAATNAENIIGKMARFNNLLDEMKRQLGKGVTPELEEWLTLLTKIGEDGTSAIQKLVDAITAISNAAQLAFIALSKLTSLDFTPIGLLNLPGKLRQAFEEAGPELESALAESAEAAAERRVAFEAEQQKRLAELEKTGREELEKIKTDRAAKGSEERAKKDEETTASSLQRLRGQWSDFFLSLSQDQAAAAGSATAAGPTLDFAAANQGLDELRGKLAGLQQAQTDELFGFADPAKLSALNSQILETRNKIAAWVPAQQAAQVATQATTQSYGAQSSVLAGLAAQVQALAPILQRGSAVQRQAAALQIASLQRLAEAGGATEGDLRRFGQSMAQIFPQIGADIAAGTEPGTKSIAALQEIVSELEGTAATTGVALGETAEGTQTLTSAVESAGEQIPLTNELIQEFQASLQALGQDSAEVADGVTIFADGTVKLADGAKDAAEGASDLAGAVPDVAATADKAAAPVEELGEAATTAGEGLQDAASGASAFTAEGDSAAVAAERLADGIGGSASSVERLTEAVSGSASDREELRKNLEDLAAFAERLQAALTAINESRALLDLAVDARVAAEELDKAASAANRLRENAASVALA